MAKSIQSYRDQFLMTKQCKNVKVKNSELVKLLDDMEEDFSIPARNDELYNKANPVVIALYREIGDERVIEEEIKEITQEEADALLESNIVGREKYKPEGLFYKAENFNGKEIYVGIDNSDGCAWTEEFNDLEDCKAWLKGETQI